MNYEMGIVLPLKSNKEIEDIVCWERPARKYVLGKDRAWVSPTCTFFVRNACQQLTFQLDAR